MCHHLFEELITRTSHNKVIKNNIYVYMCGFVCVQKIRQRLSFQSCFVEHDKKENVFLIFLHIIG